MVHGFSSSGKLGLLGQGLSCEIEAVFDIAVKVKQYLISSIIDQSSA